jgi:thymidylate kinase
MFVIECYGLPGSGKTFLAEYLEEELRRNGLKVVNRDKSVTTGLITRDDGQMSNICKRYLPETLWRRIINKDFCLQEFWDHLGGHLDFGHVVFKTLHTVKLPRGHIRSILGSVFGTCVEYQLLGNINKDFKYNIFVADEWFCHRFHTLYGNSSLSVSTDEADEYISTIPLSDVSIFVSTDPQTCMARMRDRKRFPEYLEPLNEPEVLRNLEITFNNFQILTERLKNSTVHVINYEGRSPAAVLDACIARFDAS